MTASKIIKPVIKSIAIKKVLRWFMFKAKEGPWIDQGEN
jgi:hypothetical protein